jgi:SIR2-like domain
LHAIFDRERAPGPVHRFLASLPATLRERGAPQQLIVTTAWDRSTERAFADAGEAIDVISYLALGRDRGKFVHHRAEGEAQVIHLPNAYTEVPLGERPVLLKIHGEVGLAPERDWESFVVSEDDYISYLAEAGIAGGLPVTVAARLRRSHFLFLGYGVVDWSLRVFLHRLWPDAQIGYRSWAVEQPSAVLEQEFWRRRGVEPVVAEIAGYAERLHGSILELDVVA